tara:strand:+ start:60 stop:386 length:327 start_codon:yes stop_codon:yes gene_type:complete
MRYMNPAASEIKKADEEGAIFYALKFTLNKQGKNGSGPYYALCLPHANHTLVLPDSTICSEHLSQFVRHVRYTRGIGYPKFSKIDTQKPESIPETELTDSEPEATVFF